MKTASTDWNPRRQQSFVRKCSRPRAQQALLLREPIRELAPELSLRTCANRPAEPFDRRQRWADDAACAEFLEQCGHQRRSMVSHERRRQQAISRYMARVNGRSPRVA